MKHDISNVGEIERLAVPVSRHDHVQGPPEAPLTLVEYGDYECPFCGQAYGVVKTIQRQAGNRLRFVFRNFPLTNMHPHSEHAAEAAEAASARDRFWEMHDVLFENQDALEDEDLAQFAAKLGLDAVGFIAEVQSEAHARRIREDFMSGVRSGVNGTPTFFINDIRHDGGFDVESLLAGLARAGKWRD